MEGQPTQDVEAGAENHERVPVGKAETPPPTYEDACHYILTGRHPVSGNNHVMLEPPPDYPQDSYSIPMSNMEQHPQYVNISSDHPHHGSDDAQDTMVIATEEDFPRTCSICKKIGAYLVAIFWISICSIQLLMGVGIAHHSNFEKFLWGGGLYGKNRHAGNAMFMFWMVTLFANIVLLFGIINKNRCNLLMWLMFNKMLMLLLLFSLFFPGIPFFTNDRYSGTTDTRFNAKSNRFFVIITVVILYIGSIAVKLFYDQLDSNHGLHRPSDVAVRSSTSVRTFPASWPINWSAYSNPTLRPIPNILEGSRRQRERRQRRRDQMQSYQVSERQSSQNNF